jgi:hypothetical protein
MQQGPVWPGQRRPRGVMHETINRVRRRSANSSERPESDPTRPSVITTTMVQHHVKKPIGEFSLTPGFNVGYILPFG